MKAESIKSVASVDRRSKSGSPERWSDGREGGVSGGGEKEGEAKAFGNARTISDVIFSLCNTGGSGFMNVRLY